MHNHHITLLAKNYMVSLHDLSLHGEEMHQKWCPFPHFVGLATNFPFTLVTKFLFKRRGYWIYYCVLAIVYLLSSTIISLFETFLLEKDTFTPAIFRTSGGTGKEADKLIRCIAVCMTLKRCDSYSSVVSLN